MHKHLKAKKEWLMALAIVGVVMVFALPGIFRAQDGDELTNPVPMTPESIAEGKAVFFNYCAGCHGRRADGRGKQALNLDPRPQNLRNAPFVKYLSDSRMYSSISGGVRGTAMPAFDLILKPEKRWHVINYIRSLTADDTLNLPNSIAYQPVPADTKNPISLTKESSAIGKTLYLNYCANCHGARGDGNGKLAPNLIPHPRTLVVVKSWGEKPFIDYLSDARLYDSITNGVPGTSMLPWIGVFSDEQRWHIINYLRARANEERDKEVEAYSRQE